MSKTVKAVIMLFTVMIMLFETIGVSAHTMNNNDTIQIDGVFSLGARYHYIENAYALVIDGKGSFTENEFYSAVMKYEPKIVILGDNVDIPVSGNIGNEWLFNITALSSTFTVFTNKNSNTYKLYKGELKNNFKEYIQKNNIVLGMMNYEMMFPICVLEETDNIYNEQIYNAQTATENTKISKAAEILNESKAQPTLTGDADLNGAVELSDITAIAKYELNNNAYPLKNETAYVNADMNDDKDIDQLDVSILIETQLGRKK